MAGPFPTTPELYTPSDDWSERNVGPKGGQYLGMPEGHNIPDWHDRMIDEDSLRGPLNTPPAVRKKELENIERGGSLTADQVAYIPDGKENDFPRQTLRDWVDEIQQEEQQRQQDWNQPLPIEIEEGATIGNLDPSIDNSGRVKEFSRPIVKQGMMNLGGPTDRMRFNDNPINNRAEDISRGHLSYDSWLKASEGSPEAGNDSGYPPLGFSETAAGGASEAQQTPIPEGFTDPMEAHAAIPQGFQEKIIQSPYEVARDSIKEAVDLYSKNADKFGHLTTMSAPAHAIYNIGKEILTTLYTSIEQLGTEGYDPGNSENAAVENAFNAAGAFASGGFARGAMQKAGTSELGIFGGKMAANKQGLELARDALWNGKDPQEIRKVTGWYRDVKDLQWKFEIDDSKMAWGDTINTIKSQVRDDNPVIAKLGNIIKHDEFFKQYPEARDINVIFGKSPGGEFNANVKNPWIKISAKDIGTEKGKKIIVHEAQHYVQEKEGFALGTNPEAAGWEGYMKSAGEAEANDVMQRSKMSPEQRLDIPPRLSQTTGNDHLIVQRGTGGTAKSIDNVTPDSLGKPANDNYQKAPWEIKDPGPEGQIPSTPYDDAVLQQSWDNLSKRFGKADPKEPNPVTAGEAIGRLRGAEDADLLPSLELKARNEWARLDDLHRAAGRWHPDDPNGMPNPKEYMGDLAFLKRQYREIADLAKEIRKTPDDDLAKPHLRRLLEAKMDAAGEREAKMKEMIPQLSQEPQARAPGAPGLYTGRESSAGIDLTSRMVNLFKTGKTMKQITEFVNKGNKEPVSQGTVQRRIDEWKKTPEGKEYLDSRVGTKPLTDESSMRIVEMFKAGRSSREIEREINTGNRKETVTYNQIRTKISQFEKSDDYTAWRKAQIEEMMTKGRQPEPLSGWKPENINQTRMSQLRYGEQPQVSSVWNKADISKEGPLTARFAGELSTNRGGPTGKVQLGVLDYVEKAINAEPGRTFPYPTEIAKALGMTTDAKGRQSVQHALKFLHQKGYLKREGSNYVLKENK